MNDEHSTPLVGPEGYRCQPPPVESFTEVNNQKNITPRTIPNEQGDTDMLDNGNGTYRDVELSTIPMLPESIHLSYVAEGAANIIYRFSLPSDLSDAVGLPASVGDTHLLRLRKALPSGSPNLPAFAALQKIFFPLFPKEFLLDTRIVRIPEGLIEQQNAILKEREEAGSRLLKRKKLYLVGPPPPPGTPLEENGGKSPQYERYAFLVEDMTPAAPDVKTAEGRTLREVLVEFKPKWLVPSPSAPPGARRCRSCALRISKEAKKHSIHIAGNGSGNPGHWCPYDLASGDAHRVRLAVRGMLAQKGAILTGWKNAKGGKGEINGYESMILEDKVVGYFLGPRGRDLLSLLKRYQSQWDKRGPEAVFGENGDQNTEPAVGSNRHDGEWGDEWSEDVKKFLMAMTVRDLTLFLKVDLSTPPLSDPNAIDMSVQGRIGDLDLKSPENGKAKYWIEVERKLRNEGWYTGTEHTGQTNGHRPLATRNGSVAGDKRKHDEVEGKIQEGRRIGPTGDLIDVVVDRNTEAESVDVAVERAREEEGLGPETRPERDTSTRPEPETRPEVAGSIRWCTF